MWLLTGDEQKILLYTARRIFGFHKERDNISLSQFSDGITSRSGQTLDHGTGMNRSAVINALSILTACRIILEVEDGHSQAGKCYSLQLDSEQIDLAPLQTRRQEKHEIGQRRTEKARQASQQVVSPTDQQVVSPTDQQWSVPLTSSGQSHRPAVVSPTDTHKQRGNKEETKRERAPAPDSQKSPTSILCDAYRDVADNYKLQTQLQNQIIALNGATADQVEQWLASRKTLCGINFIAQEFKLWLTNQRRVTTPPTAKKHSCPKCLDTGSVSVFENGEFLKYADCPACQGVMV